MKIAPTVKNDNYVGKKALLPLVPEDEHPLTKDNSVNLELRTVPTDNTSAKIKVSCRLLRGDEDLRSMIKWLDDVETKIFPGLNLQDGAPQAAMVSNLMEGSPKESFREKIQELATAARLAAAEAADPNPAQAAHINVLAEPLADHTTAALVSEALRFMLQGIMPLKTLERVKRYMRRDCRKPANMKIRYFYQLLNKMNNAEIPRVPPFNPNQGFQPDELMEIILYAVPKSWIREMDRQGIDPLDGTQTIHTVVSFFERIEATEEHDQNAKVSSKKNGNGKKVAHKSNGNGYTGDKYCMLHGTGGHTSEECHKLKAESKRLKSSTDYSSKGNGKAAYGNKGYKPKYDKGSKELNAFVKKSIKEGVRKELNSIQDKKRKASDDDEAELAAIDVVLKDFNYQDMDDLRIDSEDEGHIDV